MSVDWKRGIRLLRKGLDEQGIRSIAPVRKGAKRGRIRRKLMRNFPQKTYNKRNRNENVNFVFKNRYGDYLKAYTVIGRRAEIATKIVAYNLWARLKALLYGLFNIAFWSNIFKHPSFSLPYAVKTDKVHKGHRNDKIRSIR